MSPDLQREKQVLRDPAGTARLQNFTEAMTTGVQWLCQAVWQRLAFQGLP